MNKENNVENKDSEKEIEFLTKKLQSAIKEMDELSDEQKLDMGNGEKYTKVVQRNKILRKHFGLKARILTKILHQVEHFVILRSKIQFLVNGKWVTYGNGHVKKRLDINDKFASIETAETVAIGRALASVGLSGDEFASDIEVSSNTKKTSIKKEPETNKNDNAIKKVTKATVNAIMKKIEKSDNYGVEDICNIYNVKELSELNRGQSEDIRKRLDGKKFNVTKYDIENILNKTGYDRKRFLADYNVDNIEEMDENKLYEAYVILKNRDSLMEDKDKKEKTGKGMGNVKVDNSLV